MQQDLDKTNTPNETQARQAGFSIAEVVVAMTLLGLIALGGGVAVASGMGYQRDLLDEHQVIHAIENQLAEIQDIANRTEDLGAQEGISAIMSRFDGQVITIPGVPNGQISLTCFANEATVPAILGGPQDLNFDGDAADDLGNASLGTDLKLVPMVINVTYGLNSQNSLTFHTLITTTTQE